MKKSNLRSMIGGATLSAILAGCSGTNSFSKDANWYGELPSYPGYTVAVNTRYFGNGESGESYHGQIYYGDNFRESLIIDDPFLDKGVGEMLKIQHSSVSDSIRLTDSSRLRDLSLRDITSMMDQAVELAKSAKAKKDSLSQ